MLQEQLYSQVERSPNGFSAFASVIILFFSGVSFTFVVPGLPGFSLYFTMLTLLMYFIAANIFVGMFREKVWFVLLLCFLLSSLGMGWWLWLEWREFTLAEYTNPTVYVGYPSITALIITAIFLVMRVVLKRNAN